MKQLTIQGTVWDFWAINTLLNKLCESRYLSFYEPLLYNTIKKDKIIVLHEKNKTFLLWPIKIIRRVFHITKQLRLFQPDVVIAHHDDAIISLLPVLLVNSFRKKRPRFIAWIHANPERGFESRLYSFIVSHIGRALYRFYDLVITPSEGNKQIIHRYYNIPLNRIKVVPNPIDVADIRAKARVPLKKEHAKTFAKGKIIINIGRLTKQKGQWHLIRAFKEVKKRFPDVKLVILGEGELRQKLTKLVKELQLEESVFLLGFQENPYQFLARSRLFVLSSLWETFGQVIVEAMACGIPVISTDCRAGPREILSPKKPLPKRIKKEEITPYGILTPPLEDTFISGESPLTIAEKNLVKAIEKIISKDNSSLIKRGKERAREFDTEQISKIIKKIISN